MWATSWFGGGGAQKRKDAPKKAILDLRQQLEMLQKRERHLENQMAKQDEIAKANVTTNKTGRFSPAALGEVDTPIMGREREWRGSRSVQDRRFCMAGSFLSHGIYADAMSSGAERTQTEETA